MIVYGCMNGKLKNKIVKDISLKRAITILRYNFYNIIIKSLPGNGNMGLRKKDIKPYVENKSDGKTAFNISLSKYIMLIIYYIHLILLISAASISVSLLACIALSLIIISIILFFDILLELIGNLE